jgi:hypothetical protein
MSISRAALRGSSSAVLILINGNIPKWSNSRGRALFVCVSSRKISLYHLCAGSCVILFHDGITITKLAGWSWETFFRMAGQPFRFIGATLKKVQSRRFPIREWLNSFLAMRDCGLDGVSLQVSTRLLLLGGDDLAGHLIIFHLATWTSVDLSYYSDWYGHGTTSSGREIRCVVSKKRTGDCIRRPLRWGTWGWAGLTGYVWEYETVFHLQYIHIALTSKEKQNKMFLSCLDLSASGYFGNLTHCQANLIITQINSHCERDLQHWQWIVATDSQLSSGLRWD